MPAPALSPSASRTALLSALLATGMATAQGDEANRAQANDPTVPPLVARFCAECHGDGEAEADFRVAPLFATTTPEHAHDARVALQRLRSRTMPPADADHQPTAAERLELAAAFAARVPVEPDARIAPLRHLTPTEYERTIAALFGIAWHHGGRLPDAARAAGFDNQGDVMNVAPVLFEAWFAAADEISGLVLADAAATARTFGTDAPLATALPPLLERVFRRPATTDELESRLALAAQLQQAGEPLPTIHRALLRSLLASPAFLFRAETGRSDDPARLTPHELAVRLSYLLTSSLPDEPLLALARSGRLEGPGVLVGEAQRLLAQDGGRSLADGFAAQWLRFRDVLTTSADFRRYPQIWNGDLRPSFYEEAARTFAALATEDRSILELLDADTTFVNATLARHYGLPEPKEPGFHRVTLPDRRRGDVLGMGAILMVSSFPLRTSPVLRGKWILDTLLDAGTPPPPANAGVLPPDDAPQEGLSLRERLQRHRRDRACASCHAQMDPLGFALENYDVLGQWRDQLHGQPIDVRGELADGTSLDGPIALKDALRARPLEFARTFAKHLLVYAIGRPLLPADEAELTAIAAATAAGDYRFLALLAAVVTSPLFVQRDPSTPLPTAPSHETRR